MKPAVQEKAALRVDELRSVERALVYKAGTEAGVLERRAGGVSFAYQDKYLAAGLPAVASTLPLRSEPYQAAAGAVPPFFAGLLPEGARLDALVAAAKTSRDDELSLLLAVGDDPVGDVQVLSQAVSPQAVSPQAVSPQAASPTQAAGETAITAPATATATAPATEPANASFAGVSFRELYTRSLGYATAPDAAIPGVQDKLSHAVIAIPFSRGGGPCMLKLEPERFPRLARNEAFFLAMARDCGFTVPAFRVVEDGQGEFGLLTERFDRRVVDGRVLRIAQEDGCQLAGRWPADKYRLSMAELVETLAAASSSAPATTLHVLLLAALGYLVGNGDMHARNFSLSWRPVDTDESAVFGAGPLVVPTPVYDLLSTLPYPLDQHMALQMDGRDDGLRASDFVAFGQRHGVAPALLQRRLALLCRRARPWLQRFEEIGFDADTTRRVRASMDRRMADLGRGLTS